LVDQPDVATIAGPATQALSDTSPRVRIVAARILAVRDVRGAAGAVAEQLSRETDIAAAREEIRTLALLNGKDQLTTMLAGSRRFNGLLDLDLALALGRGDGPAAVDAYVPTLAHLALSPEDRVAFFRYALWGFPRVLTQVAARMLGAHDPAAWEAVLRVASESSQDIAGGVLLAGMQDSDPSTRTASAFYLASRPIASLQPYRAQLEAILSQPPAADTAADSAIALELLRRSLGQSPKRDLPWSALSRALAERLISVKRLLSKDELKLLKLDERTRANATPSDEDPSALPPAVLTNVPAGLTSAVMSMEGCDGTWLGNAAFSIDRGGRLIKINVDDVHTSDACKATLAILLKISLAEPRTMRTPIGDGTAIVAHGGKAMVCFDEAPVRTAIGQPVGPVAIRGVVKAPKVMRRVGPKAPRPSNGRVVLRMVISVDGCPRDFQLVHADDPSLAAASVVAVSQWKFEPATWNGKPVEAILNLTISFNHG
jgi:hypothetical protein